MKKMLIVVDMINGFIREGNLSDERIAKIIPGCQDYIKEYLDNGRQVVAFVDSHTQESKEFGAYPVHCLAGTTESALVDELAVYSEDIRIIVKNSTNGMFAPGFKEYLDRISEYVEILIVGCCTDICVLQLALSLKAFCNEKDYDCEIVVDELACETFEIPGHEAATYNELAFGLLRSSGIKVIRGKNDE